MSNGQDVVDSDARWSDVYGGAYFNLADLAGGGLEGVQITEVQCLELSLPGKRQVNIRVVLTLEGQRRKVALNKTSAKALFKAWGGGADQELPAVEIAKRFVGKLVDVQAGIASGKQAILVTPSRKQTKPGVAPDTAPADDIKPRGKPSDPSVVDRMKRMKRELYDANEKDALRSKTEWDEATERAGVAGKMAADLTMADLDRVSEELRKGGAQ